MMSSLLRKKNQLVKLSSNLINLSRKLETKELEVAVVGLEKAGKSKFSSAFVGKEGLFPSADERCTFTSTKLQYAPEDYAEVEFYTKEEFSKKFDSMLNEVKCPNVQFESMQRETFERYFDSLKVADKGLYERHRSKTEKDIIDIINGKNDIVKLLSHDNKKFSDFKSAELTLYITDKYVSRAVKNVTFYSSNLEGLKNIILYDVPGFDSPTQVHLDQTIKKLQDVDAIVMIKNIKEPSLKAGEVDILVQNGDMDGIKLYEKLFVFGSKADFVSSLNDLNKNKEMLIQDLTDNLKNNFNINRLFTGCLDKNFEQRLELMGSKTQLEELKDALRYYNEIERGFILEKRVNKTIEDVKSLFKIISDRNSDINNAIDGYKFDLYGELLDNSRKALDEKLSKFINRHKKDIELNKLFTSELNAKVEHIAPIIDSNYLNDISEEISSSDTRGVIDFYELNRKTRAKLTTQVKRNFIELVLSVSKEKRDEIEQEMIGIFLEVLNVNQFNPKYDLLKEKIKSFIEESTKNAQFEQAGFKVIVDRFTVDLIDTMIGFPLGRNARKDRFDKGRKDLYMLSPFSKNHPCDTPSKSDLIGRVLAQESMQENSHLDDAYENIDDYLKQIRSAILAKGARGPSNSNVSELAKVISEKAIKSKIPLQIILTKISNLNKLPSGPLDIPLFVFNELTKYLDDHTETTQATNVDP